MGLAISDERADMLNELIRSCPEFVKKGRSIAVKEDTDEMVINGRLLSQDNDEILEIHRVSADAPTESGYTEWHLLLFRRENEDNKAFTKTGEIAFLENNYNYYPYIYMENESDFTAKHPYFAGNEKGIGMETAEETPDMIIHREHVGQALEDILERFIGNQD